MPTYFHHFPNTMYYAYFSIIIAQFRQKGNIEFKNLPLIYNAQLQILISEKSKQGQVKIMEGKK